MCTVVFNGFWKGFSDGTDGINVRFFDIIFNLLGIEYTITNDMHVANVLVESFFTQTPLVSSKKWRWSIFFSGESYIPHNHREYTIVYSSRVGIILLIINVLFNINNNFDILVSGYLHV